MSDDKSGDKQEKQKAEAKKIGDDSLRPIDQQGDVAAKTEKSKEKAAEQTKNTLQPIDQQTHNHQGDK